MGKIGFLTIGQAPRDDVVSEMSLLLPSGLEIIQAGALDGLTPEQIKLLAPAGKEFPLATRLSQGRSVVVSREKIIPLLQAQIHKLESIGIDILALLCTENFPEITSTKTLLQPFLIMKQEVESMPRPMKAVVLTPLEAQKEEARKKWEAPGLEVLTAAMNPYATHQDLQPMIQIIKQEKATIIIFDCIGYPLSLAQSLCHQSGLPYLLPRSSLALTIRRLLQE